jgi:hypothetical protein
LILALIAVPLSSPPLAGDNGIEWLRQPMGDGEELVVANAADYSFRAQWHLRGPDGTIHELVDAVGGLQKIDRLLPSPDGELLAVVSSGSCGNTLEVVELRALRTAGTYKVRREVDPFPGTIGEVAWDGDDLVLESDIALTHAGPDGRVDESLLLPSSEWFVLRRASWRLESVTFSTRDLVERLLAQLTQEERWEARAEAIRALAALAELKALPDVAAELAAVLNREPTVAVRRELRRAIALLRRDPGSPR